MLDFLKSRDQQLAEESVRLDKEMKLIDLAMDVEKKKQERDTKREALEALRAKRPLPLPRRGVARP